MNMLFNKYIIKKNIMKKLIHLFICLLAFLTISCICVYPDDTFGYMEIPFPVETFLLNTLDYPIEVQCYYIPYNNNHTSGWINHEEKIFGDPVIIQPREAKVIMDYVLPTKLVIRNANSGTLLWEYQQKPPFKEMYPTHDEALIRLAMPEESYGFLPTDSVLHIYPLDPDDFATAWWDKQDRYLAQNIDWAEYPIWYQYFYEIDNSSHTESGRVNFYRENANGYAVVQFLTTNHAAACFQCQ